MTGTILERFTSKGSILEASRDNLPDGVLCRAKYQICSIGERNRNNRVYERAVWDKVLADKDINEKLRNRSLFFHAEHPATTQSNTEKVAGVVTEITLDSDKAYAIMEVLDTPYGRIVDTLLRAGCGIGVSTRADGELEECMDENGQKYSKVVPDSYKFVTVDFTADPSSYGSEVPLEVKRNVVGVVKAGIDNEKIDREYATVLLEHLDMPEAVALLESMKMDKHHDGCKCKASEKKCGEGCPHANEKIVDWTCECGEKAKASDIYDEKICAKCQKKMKRVTDFEDVPFDESKVTEVIKKVGDKWQVQSHTGKNLGTYSSKAEAHKRLGQVEYFKHKNEETEKPFIVDKDKNTDMAKKESDEKEIARATTSAAQQGAMMATGGLSVAVMEAGTEQMAVWMSDRPGVYFNKTLGFEGTKEQAEDFAVK